MSMFIINFATGKLEPVEAAGMLPVGQLVTYEDQANPQKQYVVTGAKLNPHAYGQDCICEDGHRSSVSVSAIEGPGGWRLVNQILSAAGIAAFLHAAEIRKQREDAEKDETKNKKAAARASAMAQLPVEFPKLELQAKSKKSRHALGAANIRKLLREKWPLCAFAVTSDSYSGGSSIDVSWVDGPTSEAVNAITDRFQKCDFNGMDDSEHYRDSVWVDLFGGAKYVMAQRSVSDERMRAVADEMGYAGREIKWGDLVGEDHSGNHWFRKAYNERSYYGAPATACGACTGFVEPSQVEPVAEPLHIEPAPLPVFGLPIVSECFAVVAMAQSLTA